MNKELAKTIGTATRQARKALRLTQADAAERVGLSVEFFARIERGTSLPSIISFARIVSVLGVSADALLGQHPLSMSTGAVWTPAPTTERPEIRRVLRRLRQASPGALRLVSMLLKEFDEAHGVGQKSVNDSEVASTTDVDRADANDGDSTASSERLSSAHLRDFEAGAHARPKRAQEPSAHADDALGWSREASVDGEAYSRTA